MSINPNCDFCKKELSAPSGLLFSPPKKSGEVKKLHICAKCYKEFLKITRLKIREIEDILSLGPAWLNYKRRVKRSK